MNEIERDRIAAAMHQLRPDWPAASLRTLLDRPALRDRPRRDVAVALAWIACDAKTQTPGRVTESGPWWQAAAIEGSDSGGAPRHTFDPKSSCDECSQPEHRHVAHSGHEFVSVHDAMRRRQNAPKPPLPRMTAPIPRDARVAAEPQRAKEKS